MRLKQAWSLYSTLIEFCIQLLLFLDFEMMVLRSWQEMSKQKIEDQDVFLLILDQITVAPNFTIERDSYKVYCLKVTKDKTETIEERNETQKIIEITPDY